MQHFASTAAALSPLIGSATWPPDRTFGDACMPLSASSSNAGAVAEGLGWSENGHWRENNSKRLDFQGGAPDAERIPGVRGMQSGLNSVSMAMGVMEKALYSFYTLDHCCPVKE